MAVANRRRVFRSFVAVDVVVSVVGLFFFFVFSSRPPRFSLPLIPHPRSSHISTQKQSLKTLSEGGERKKRRKHSVCSRERATLCTASSSSLQSAAADVTEGKKQKTLFHFRASKTPTSRNSPANFSTPTARQRVNLVKEIKKCTFGRGFGFAFRVRKNTAAAAVAIVEAKKNVDELGRKKTMNL